jgi:hypothetical protein
MLTIVLLGSGLARAGGFAPVVAPAWGVEASAGLATGRNVLTATDCAGACTAWREVHARGVNVRVTGPSVAGVSTAVWLEGELATATVDAARWSGDGTRVGVGVQGEHLLGGGALDGWLGLEETRHDDGRTRRLHPGAAWVVGTPDDGVRVWIGAEASVTLKDRLQALDGEVPLAFTATPPAQLVAGARITSDPLGGPWATRGRLVLDVHAALGGENRLGAGLGYAW